MERAAMARRKSIPLGDPPELLDNEWTATAEEIYLREVAHWKILWLRARDELTQPGDQKTRMRRALALLGLNLNMNPAHRTHQAWDYIALRTGATDRPRSEREQARAPLGVREAIACIKRRFVLQSDDACIDGLNELKLELLRDYAARTLPAEQRDEARVLIEWLAELPYIRGRSKPKPAKGASPSNAGASPKTASVPPRSERPVRARRPRATEQALRKKRETMRRRLTALDNAALLLVKRAECSVAPRMTLAQVNERVRRARVRAAKSG